MSASSKKNTRIQFELSEEAYARLNYLKKRTDATSYSEVCKKALRINAALLRRVEEGGRFFMKDEHGNLTELAILV
jgi:predicted DNA-binding protein